MEQVTELLKELAEKLGTTVEHLWGVLLVQAQVQMIILLVLFVGTILSFISWLPYFRWVMKKELNDWDAEEGIFAFVVLIIWGIITGCLIIVSFVSIETFVTVIKNPEYFALQKVLSLFK